MLDDQMYNHLQQKPNLVALVGERMWPNKLKELGTMPALVWTNLNTAPDYSHNGDSGLDDALYQFACWGNTPLSARGVADQVRAALGGKSAGLPDGTKFTAFVEAIRAMDDAESGLARVMVDVRFQVSQ
jgi:hypothetical protein